METKVCLRCGDEKPFTDFYKNRMCKDGYRNYCKLCCKNKQNEYREENRDIILEKKKEDYYNNRQSILEYKKIKYYEDPYNSPLEVLNRKDIRHQEAIENEKKSQREYRRERYKNDPIFRMKYNIRRRINDFIKGKNKKTPDILGCSYSFFKEHIEKLFSNGMSWDNYGQYGWHLDHIIPLASAKNEEEIYKLNHYTNFQPLWWHENLSKGDKLPEEWLSENTSN
jgi:hypothetical protein